MTQSGTRLTTLVALAIVASAPTGQLQTQTAQSQAPPPQLSLPAMSQDEAGRIAAGWAVLAQGKHGEAAAYADTLLQQFPRSPGSLSFAIEAQIAGRGSATALETYERWLNGRTVEEPGVLARIGRAVLFEWSRQTGDKTARIEALRSLAAEGVQEAAAVLVAAANAGGAGEGRALVALGDPAAIDKVLGRLKTPTGPKGTDIFVLGESKSPRVVQPLIDLLADKDPNNRAAAADALRKVGNRDAAAPLKALYESSTGFVRIAAAGGLLQFGDISGLVELRNMAAGNAPVEIRRSMAIYLASRPDDDWKALVHGLASEPAPQYRLKAAELLAPFEEEFSKSLFEALMLDPNPEIRDDAGVLFAHDMRHIDYPTLRRLLRVQSGRIRVAAAARLMANVR